MPKMPHTRFRKGHCHTAASIVERPGQKEEGWGLSGNRTTGKVADGCSLLESLRELSMRKKKIMAINKG